MSTTLACNDNAELLIFNCRTGEQRIAACQLIQPPYFPVLSIEPKNLNQSTKNTKYTK